MPYNDGGLAEVVNWKDTNTTKIRAGLLAARNLERLSEWVVQSDSSGTGGLLPDSSFDHLQAWPLFMRQHLEENDIPVAGTGMVRTLDNILVDDRWATISGTWFTQHKTFAYCTANGATIELTPDRGGDRLTVMYYDGGTAEPLTFTTLVDGVTVSVSNSSMAGWRKTTRTVDIDAAEAIRLAKTAGIYFAPAAACVWDSAGGLLIHNVGQGGSSARGTGTAHDRWSNDVTREGLPQVFGNPCVGNDPPDCVIYAIGGNDKRLGVSDTLVIDAIKKRREAYPDSDFIIVAETKLSNALVAEATWETFLDALHTLAVDTLDVPLIDQYARLGTYTEIVAAGLNADTDGHLKPIALEDLGRSVGRLLLDSIEEVPDPDPPTPELPHRFDLDTDPRFNRYQLVGMGLSCAICGVLLGDPELHYTTDHPEV